MGQCPSSSLPQSSEVQVPACSSSTGSAVASAVEAMDSRGATVVLRAHTCPNATMERVSSPAKYGAMRERTSNLWLPYHLSPK